MPEPSAPPAGGEAEETASAPRLRRIFIAATVLLVVLLAFFAWAIIHVQNQRESDLNDRFHDRAAVAAAVTDSLFSFASKQSQLQDAKDFGGATVGERKLIARQAQGNQTYIQILSADGTVLASTPHAPPRPRTDVLVRRALRTHKIQYSGILPGAGGRTIIESATPFPTIHGPRVDVVGSDSAIISQFLGGFLDQIPNVENSRSYVVDAQNQVIASRGVKVVPGMPLPDKELAQASSGKSQGAYDGNRYFVTAPLASVPWRFLATTSQDDLYSSISGSQEYLPWIIWVAFALSAGVGLFLVRRVLRQSAELERAELSRRYALEINDNVVQRLVVAKYALDRGATEMSQEKMAETLRETQQLVTNLLAEREIQPGVLRRSAAAETDKPPESAPPKTGESE